MVPAAARVGGVAPSCSARHQPALGARNERVKKNTVVSFERVKETVGNLPFIRRANAKMLYDFIVEHDVRHVLELGVAHGVASCFIAAALQQVDHKTKARPSDPNPPLPPKLTSVDLLSNRSKWSPSIEELLGTLDLVEYVDIRWTQTGYHWFLHDEIRDQSGAENRCRPKYDLVIFDCKKNWTDESGGFFLADKLLKPGGAIIWDDYNWTYAETDNSRSASLSKDERETPHVAEVVHLLAMQHPNYQDFKIVEDGDWAWAYKKKVGDGGCPSDGKRVELVRSRALSWYTGYVLHRLDRILRRFTSRS